MVPSRTAHYSCDLFLSDSDTYVQDRRPDKSKSEFRWMIAICWLSPLPPTTEHIQVSGRRGQMMLIWNRVEEGMPSNSSKYSNIFFCFGVVVACKRDFLIYVCGYRRDGCGGRKNPPLPSLPWSFEWDVVENGGGGEAIWSALKRKTNFQTEENVRINKQKKFITTALVQ